MSSQRKGLSRLAAFVAMAGLACATAPMPGGDAEVAAASAGTSSKRAPLEWRTRAHSPVELVARGGEVIPLRVLEVRGEVEGPLAFTELHLEFENSDPRTQEAVLEMVLPTRAKLARFAIEHDGKWSDAQVIPRDAVAHRDSLQAKSPPAIDYGDQGQLFRVVVPQVKGRARTRMVVAYRELLAGSQEPYRVHLQGLPELERFYARVRGAVGADREAAPKEGAVGRDGIESERKQYQPVGDLVLRSPRHRTVAVHRDGLVAARIRPLTHDHHDSLNSLTVLFDTSASRAPGFDRSIEHLQATLEELQRWTSTNTRVHIVAFDQSYETVYEGPLRQLSGEHFERLRERRALGASDLGAALRYIRRRPGHRYDRLLLVTDGVVTAGTRDLDRLSATIASLGDAGLRRLDVLEDGGLRDHSTLRRLTRVLPNPGMVLDPREGKRALARRLLRGVETDVEIDVPGARWVYPNVIEGLQAGDELIVFAEFGRALKPDELSIRVTGEISAEHPIDWQETARPLLATAVAEAHVEDLSAALLDSRDQPREVRRAAYRQILELSGSHRLLNDFTRFSMLAPSSQGAEAATEEGDETPAGEAAELARALVMGPRHTEEREPTAWAQSPTTARFTRRYLTVDRLALVLQLEAAQRERALVAAPALDLGAKAVEQGARAGAELLADTPVAAREVVAAVDFVGELRHDFQRDAKRRFGGEDADQTVTTRRGHWSTWGQGRSTRSTSPRREPSDAHEGNLLAVMNLLAWGEDAQAKRYALAWRERDPADPLALVALGEAYEAQAAPDRATRAYGSLIDLYPDRPDVRRFAGTRLEGLSQRADDLAIDSFRRALDQDPDSPGSHRALAFALLRRGRHSRAFEVLEGGLGRRFDKGRHAGAAAGLREDLGIIGAAWARHEPGTESKILARLKSAGASLSRHPSVRVALSWETPDSDADLHVRDSAGHHAYHDSPALPGGGRLQGDVTAGFGVERFEDRAVASPERYELQVHYFSRGPLGYGMGSVEILEHDGRGGLRFELRPFVVNKERSFVDLGVWPNPPAPAVEPSAPGKTQSATRSTLPGGR